MTIFDALRLTAEQKPNGQTEEMLIRWLSKLDGMVKRLVIDTHEGWEDVAFTGYDQDTDRETVLLIPEPWDDAYLHWLAAQIDLANLEYDGYNANIAMYNAVYEAFENDYHRNHRHRDTGNRFRF